MKYFYFLYLFVSAFVHGQQTFDMAKKEYQLKNYAAAKTLFEQDLREFPSNLKTVEYLGDIQSHSKNWENAIVYYEKLKLAKPNIANYQYKYGGVLAMIAKNSNKFRALTMIGTIEEAFLNAVKLDPDHIDAHWALVEYYLQVPAIFGGSERKATSHANVLLKISPVDGYLAKGRIAEYFERYNTAEKYYKNAIAIGNSKTTYKKLADLYKNKMNQPEKAKQLMERFAEKD